MSWASRPTHPSPFILQSPELLPCTPAFEGQKRLWQVVAFVLSFVFSREGLEEETSSGRPAGRGSLKTTRSCETTMASVVLRMQG